MGITQESISSLKSKFESEDITAAMSSQWTTGVRTTKKTNSTTSSRKGKKIRSIASSSGFRSLNRNQT